MTGTFQSSALILHAGAIGDVVLGTLVPAAIKRARPDLRVIYWTHESLFDLLRLCPYIDEFVVWDKKKSLWHQRSIVRGAQAEVLIDMSSSLRTRMISLVSGTRTLRYVKQPAQARPIVHAADNFLETVAPLVGKVDVNFPTLEIPNDERSSVATIALVPGVGSLRSHRAWPVEGWIELGKRLLEAGFNVVLIGGNDDVQVAHQIETALGPAVINHAGKLDLPGTAEALAKCQAAVSGDTGPSHIAVAVGTPVVGLLGPTYPERSGPYGYLKNSLNAGHQCRCHSAKSCLVTGAPGPGECMRTISVEQVYERLAPFCLENSRQ
jgi:heptosyltransferase I